jgi:uncharacterized protein YxjI
MRYLLNKPGLFKRRYVISDQSGAERYRIDTTMFGNKYKLRNNEGETLIEIVDQTFKGYEFFRNGQKLARIPIGFFRRLSHAELSNGRNIKISRNFWGNRCVLSDESGELATARRPLIPASKIGHIDLPEGEEELLLLAIYIAVDIELNRSSGPGAGAG